jgi:hypothetical protein
MIITLTVSSILAFNSQKTQSMPGLKKKNEEANKFWLSYKVPVFFFNFKIKYNSCSANASEK